MEIEDKAIENLQEGEMVTGFSSVFAYFSELRGNGSNFSKPVARFMDKHFINILIPQTHDIEVILLHFLLRTRPLIRHFGNYMDHNGRMLNKMCVDM